MRRRDREVTDIDEIAKIMDRCDVCRIAINDEVYPYILPVNFGFERVGEEFVIYIHGSKHGTKHDLIKRDNRVSFEMDCSHSLIQPNGEESCTASMTYESVIGQGEMNLLADVEKERALAIILNHYQIEAKKYNPIHLSNTAVYSIKCSSYTAKRRQKNNAINQ